VKRNIIGFVGVPGVLTLGLTLGGCSGNSADVVYTNGRIYTVNEAQPWAEAVAIKDGKFLVVGSNADVEAVTGNGTEVVDLDGKFVMPGILDLHTHPFITPWYGSMNFSMQEPGDANAILAELRAYAEASPDKEWLIGGQWSLGVFPGDNPHKSQLDAIVPDRPVALLDQTGHSMWLNSRAMELAGINADTPTSQLVVIEKDPQSGEPTGTIREQAIQLVERVIPQASAEEYAPAIEDVFAMFASYGVTSQETAEGHRAPLDGVKLLEAEGRLEQRVFVGWDWKTTLNLAYTVEEIEGQIENRAIYASDLVYPNYVKIFGDGSVAANTSLLLEPYEGDPDFFGDANMTLEGFAEAFIKFDSMGVGVHIHVIGDGTAERVVAAFEIMKQTNRNTGTHHKLAHNFMTTKEQFDRLAAMQDVNVDFSPPAFHPHGAAEAAFRPPIGDARMDQTMAVKTALATGLNVGYGSDWLTLNPTPNPFIAIASLVTRENPFDPDMIGTINAGNAVTLEQAIAICTLEGAYVLGVEKILGSIEAGKFADLIVLDQNLFEIDVKKIYDTNVLHTILGGNVVYDRSMHGNEDVEGLDDVQVRVVR